MPIGNSLHIFLHFVRQAFIPHQAKDDDLVGQMMSEGTPFVYIQGYFDNYTNQ